MKLVGHHFPGLQELISKKDPLTITTKYNWLCSYLNTFMMVNVINIIAENSAVSVIGLYYEIYGGLTMIP